MPETIAGVRIPAISNTDAQPAARVRFARLCALYSRTLIVCGRVEEDRTPGWRVLMRDDGDPGRAACWRPLPAVAVVRVFVGGRELTLEHCEVVGFWQRLSLADGLYEAELTLRDPAGRTTRLQTMRLIPWDHPQRVLTRYVVAPLDHHAGIEIVAGLSARAGHGGTAGAGLRFEASAPMAVSAGDGTRWRVHARTCLHRRTRVVDVRVRIEDDAAWTLIACPGGQRSVVEHAMGVGCDADPPEVTSAGAFYRLLEASRRQWRRRWSALPADALRACAADALVAQAVARLIASRGD